MKLPTTHAKLVEKLATDLLKDDKMMNFLMAGNLYNFELEVRDMCSDIFNGIMSAVLPQACREVCEGLRDEYVASGFKKLEERPLAIELHTGHRVVVPSLYAKSLCEEVSESRHLLARHWSIIANSSPLRLSQIGMCSALCPSYDIGNELVKSFGSTQSMRPSL